MPAPTRNHQSDTDPTLYHTETDSPASDKGRIASQSDQDGGSLLSKGERVVIVLVDDTDFRVGWTNVFLA